MKTQSNQVRKNGAVKTPTAQAEIRTDGNSKAVPPYNQLCKDCENDLVSLENSGAMAIALCMMNSVELKESVHAFADFEQFDVPNFEDGIILIARQVAEMFERGSLLFRKNVEAVCDNHPLRGVGIVEMENSLLALQHLLDVQATALNGGRFALNYEVRDQLKKKFESFLPKLRVLSDFQKNGAGAA